MDRKRRYTMVYPQIASNNHLSWDCDKLWILGVAHFQTIPSSNFEVGLWGESLFGKIYLQRWHKTPTKNEPCVGERWWLFQVWCTCVPTMFGAMPSLFLVILSHAIARRNLTLVQKCFQFAGKASAVFSPSLRKLDIQNFPCFFSLKPLIGTTQAPT